MPQTRVFMYSSGRKYQAVPEDFSLERSFRVKTPEGTLNYYVFDGERYRKTYYLLIRQADGNYRVYYKARTERKFSGMMARAYNTKPVKVLPPNELSALLEPHHIAQLREAEKLLPYAKPVEDITQ